MNKNERLELENELLMSFSKVQAINKYIDELEENKQLKDNWNELKEILNDTLENGFPEMRLFAKMVLRDMQELEDK